MGKHITHKIAISRFRMFVDAAEHLRAAPGYTTDDPVELEEGREYCAKQVEQLARKWLRKAKELERRG